VVPTLNLLYTNTLLLSQKSAAAAASSSTSVGRKSARSKKQTEFYSESGLKHGEFVRSSFFVCSFVSLFVRLLISSFFHSFPFQFNLDDAAAWDSESEDDFESESESDSEVEAPKKKKVKKTAEENSRPTRENARGKVVDKVLSEAQIKRGELGRQSDCIKDSMARVENGGLLSQVLVSLGEEEEFTKVNVVNIWVHPLAGIQRRQPLGYAKYGLEQRVLNLYLASR